MAKALATKSRAAAAKEAARKRDYARRKVNEQAEIGPPPITKKQRNLGDKLRAQTSGDLLAWNRLVFPRSTGLKPLGKVQVDSIRHDQAVILQGGKICKAEPRGYGKTTRGGNAALWGVLNGYRRMIPIFSANLDKSKSLMEAWKTELVNNDLLFFMYPEIIWPLRALGNRPQRASSQTMNGKSTAVKWTADRIVLPTVEGAPGSGGILIAVPLESARGLNHKLPDGTVLRPDLVMFDDVQKDEEAENPNTVRKTTALIDHTAMMLGGHSKALSAIMACTVRVEDDLSETFLKKKSWRRVRYKMLERPADAEKELWLGKYAEIRGNWDPEDPDDEKRAHKAALGFYLDHRGEMDAGAKVTWDWAYHWDDEDPTEVSAIQHAYNILLDLGEDVFACEAQNSPIKQTGELELLSASEIAKKQSGHARNVVPKECSVLTAFVDLHHEIHYWQVWAWAPGLTGFLIDDGTFPGQGRRLFAHTRLRKRLSSIYPHHDFEARILASIDAIAFGSEEFGDGLLARQWLRTDGVPISIGKLGFDANGEASDTVKKFIFTKKATALIYPSYGRGILATSAPISRWPSGKGKGEGPEWIKTKPKPGDPLGCVFDANYWKTKWHRGMSLPMGSRGALSLYDASDDHHLRFGEHANAESPKLKKRGTADVYEWTIKPNRDNHDFDVAVGAMVAASMSGVNSVAGVPAKKSLSLAALQAARRNQR